jgi:hypothetical protein
LTNTLNIVNEQHSDNVRSHGFAIDTTRHLRHVTAPVYDGESLKRRLLSGTISVIETCIARHLGQCLGK